MPREMGVKRKGKKEGTGKRILPITFHFRLMREVLYKSSVHSSLTAVINSSKKHDKTFFSALTITERLY